jgi:hypothetical protein
VPTGGWTFKIYLTNAAQYDTDVTATITAGTYYMADDNQSDCFLFELCTRMQAAIIAKGAPFNANSFIAADINSDHKVRIKFFGSQFEDVGGAPSENDVKIAWTECTADLVAVLGFDASADDTRTDDDYPRFTADYHHAYGWYSDEDSQLLSLTSEDASLVNVIQGTSLSGKTKSQYFGERFTAELSLQHIERDKNSKTKVYSQGIGYGVAPVHPYNRNEPLECWWEEARQGIEFRVYRNGNRDTARAEDRGTSTAGNTTSTTDANKAWVTSPSRWAGRIYHIDTFTGHTYPITQSYYVSSHTAQVLTFTAAPSGLVPHDRDATYSLFDHNYQTYIVDLEKMTSFEPEEIAKIDRFNITIPLKRYVA